MLSNMNGTHEIFNSFSDNIFAWAKEDVVNILTRSKCAADNYMESDIGVSQD